MASAVTSGHDSRFLTAEAVRNEKEFREQLEFLRRQTLYTRLVQESKADKTALEVRAVIRTGLKAW
jgi:hypothetical protein